MARALEPPRNPFPESVEVGHQPYAADCERVGFGDITDRGTTHVWSPEASTDTPKSPVWVAVFEHRA